MFYYNYDICKKCGGNCCKALPGFALPKDIIKNFPDKNLKNSVIKALKSKEWSIDWYEGAEETDGKDYYFIRPAIDYKPMLEILKKTKIDMKNSFMVKRFKNLIFDPSFGGRCIFLTESGCKLSEELRPDACKRLKAKEGKNKKCTYDIKGNVKLYYGKKWEESKVNLYKIGKKLEYENEIEKQAYN